MKFFTVIIDNGDGSATTLNFRTMKDAEKFEAFQESQGNYSPSDGVVPVDTDSKDFFTDVEEYIKDCE